MNSRVKPEYVAKRTERKIWRKQMYKLAILYKAISLVSQIKGYGFESQWFSARFFPNTFFNNN